MFEKEAEEYGKENCVIQKNGLCTFVDSERTSKIWQDGAEFGYNKANEWHYVKDGDFPTDRTEKEYLVALKSEYSGFYYEIDIWCKSLHCFASNNPIKVYAWKELPVLPKESSK